MRQKYSLKCTMYIKINKNLQQLVANVLVLQTHKVLIITIVVAMKVSIKSKLIIKPIIQMI